LLIRLTLIDSTFPRQDLIDIACLMQDADNLDSIDGRPVESQVLLEAFDTPDMQPREAKVGRFSPLADARHPGDVLERRTAAS